ncbi:MAG TPA: hypothetical protein DEF48_15945 [Nostoc sp. UBA8866]|nr:hypothetical protein [Nostoc sp. UBA8866]
MAPGYPTFTNQSAFAKGVHPNQKSTFFSFRGALPKLPPSYKTKIFVNLGFSDRSMMRLEGSRT